MIYVTENTLSLSSTGLRHFLHMRGLSAGE